MPNSFELATNCQKNQTGEIIERRIGHNLLLEVQTPCTGIALKTIWDIETALEHGAVPAAQAVMIDSIKKADNKGSPLRLCLRCDI